ncbi:MAG: hypothetical protein ACUVSB_11145 [Anaerolineae bacterium]
MDDVVPHPPCRPPVHEGTLLPFRPPVHEGTLPLFHPPVHGGIEEGCQLLLDARAQDGRPAIDRLQRRRGGQGAQAVAERADTREVLGDDAYPPRRHLLQRAALGRVRPQRGQGDAMAARRQRADQVIRPHPDGSGDVRDDEEKVHCGV